MGHCCASEPSRATDLRDERSPSTFSGIAHHAPANRVPQPRLSHKLIPLPGMKARSTIVAAEPPPERTGSAGMPVAALREDVRWPWEESNWADFSASTQGVSDQPADLAEMLAGKKSDVQQHAFAHFERHRPLCPAGRMHLPGTCFIGLLHRERRGCLDVAL